MFKTSNNANIEMFRIKNFISRKMQANCNTGATSISKELKEFPGTDVYAEIVRRMLH